MIQIYNIMLIMYRIFMVKKTKTDNNTSIETGGYQI